MADNDVVGKFLGPFGKWQLRSTLLIYLVKIPSAWFMACLIFTAKSPLPAEIFCSPPDNLHINNNNTNLWVHAAHVEKFNQIENEMSFDVCKLYQNSAERFQNLTIAGKNLIECTSFDQRQHPIYYSLIHQYELICSREALISLTQSFHLLGVLLGGILANFMLKAVSPRHVMLGGMISQIFLGVATGYSQTYILHLIYRCSVAATCSMMCIGIMIVTDITQGKYRLGAVCLFEQFWSIGVILLPFVGSWWESWAIVYLSITFPTFILMYLYRWIPDSPRWLLKHGRIGEAKQVLLDAARVNGKTDFDELELEKNLKLLSDQMMKEPPEPSLLSLWNTSSDIKLKLFVSHLGWSVYLMLYFGSLLHVRAMGRNYLEVNTVIAGISEILGTFIGFALIFYTTRKWLWSSILNIITSLIAISAIFVPNSFPPFYRMVIYMATAMAEKMTISTGLSLFITCNTEIVTKEKKKICNYSGVTCSRTLVMIAPFIGFTAKFGQLVPQQLMGVINIAISLMIIIGLQTPRSLPKPENKTNNNQLYNIPVSESESQRSSTLWLSNINNRK